MYVKRNSVWLLVFFIFLSHFVVAQEITITEGPGEISLNEAFTITVTIKNERLSEYDGFPEIPGLSKRGTSSSSSTNIVNGQVSSTQSITQNYVASQEGTYVLKPFTMTVNGRQASSPGKTIKVGPPRQRNNSAYDPFSADPFDDFFGRRSAPQEFINVEADAFLALSTNKDEVYIGEGVTATLAFYVGRTNRAQLQFYDLGSQLAEILKKIRPANSWEENFEIESINVVPVTIDGKPYDQYKIYQATFYPLNLEPIKFPSVGLKLIQYQVARNPSFFGRNRKEDYKTFYTKAKTIKVKDLPPHPLKNQIAVGEYTLSEQIDQEEINTGQGFNYSMTIKGEGNISAINKPAVPNYADIEIYDPNVSMNIKRANGKVTGEKVFKYYAIPKEPDTYTLGDYFSWIFFDPRKEQYDTLKSAVTLNVTGESMKNEYISANRESKSFYDSFSSKSNRLSSRAAIETTKIIANLLIVAMMGLTAYVIFKK